MAATKKIRTSLHGKRVGLGTRSGKLIVDGREAITQDDTGLARRIQGAPSAVNTTATLALANFAAGIITSTTAAAVSATLPTGTVMSGNFPDIGTDEAFDWVVINTGATNAFTIVAATGHSIVGAAAVAASTSARFRTRYTGSAWVTYRIA